MPEPVALITGASSGIGAELARVFARHGHRLVLAARRTERLELLADQLASNAAARPLVLTVDLLKPDAGDVIQSALEREALEPEWRRWAQTHAGDSTPASLVIRASGQARPQALLPLLRTAVALGARELVLCGAPSRKLVHTQTLGEMERLEQCALVVALRPEGAPLEPLPTWSEVARVAESGERTFSVSVTSPGSGR